METVEKEIRHCHLAVLSKTDLIDDKRLFDMIEKIRRISSIVPIETSNFGRLEYSFSDRDLMQYKWSETENTVNTPENKSKTIMIKFQDEIDSAGLKSFVDDIKIDSYRIKGFARVGGVWSQMEMVGERHDVKETTKRENQQLDVISKIGPQIIRSIASSWEKNLGVAMKMKQMVCEILNGMGIYLLGKK